MKRIGKDRGLVLLLLLLILLRAFLPQEGMEAVRELLDVAMGVCAALWAYRFARRRRK